MYGFEQNDLDPNDTIPVRTLKVLLRLNLKPLQPKIQQRIEEVFASELHGKSNRDGKRLFAVPSGRNILQDYC